MLTANYLAFTSNLTPCKDITSSVIQSVRERSTLWPIVSSRRLKPDASLERHFTWQFSCESLCSEVWGRPCAPVTARKRRHRMKLSTTPIPIRASRIIKRLEIRAVRFWSESPSLVPHCHATREQALKSISDSLWRLHLPRCLSPRHSPCEQLDKVAEIGFNSWRLGYITSLEILVLGVLGQYSASTTLKLLPYNNHTIYSLR